MTLADELSISECLEQYDFVKNYLNIQPQILLNKVWKVPDQIKQNIESNSLNLKEAINSIDLTSLDLLKLAYKRYQRGVSRIPSEYNFMNLYWEMGIQGDELFELLASELNNHEW